MTTMTPGSNLPLSTSRVVVEVTAPKALDVSALLVAADGKVRSDADFVFFNQPKGPGATHRPASAGSPDAITVETDQLPGDIDKVVVTASVDGGGPFAGAEPTATVRDASSGAVIATFTSPSLHTERALVVVEVYRRQGSWKLRAVGQGYANGLEGIATDFGVSVEESASPAPAAQAPQPPAPQPPTYQPPAPAAPTYQPPAPAAPTYQPPAAPTYQPPAAPPAAPTYQPPAAPPAYPAPMPQAPQPPGYQQPAYPQQPAPQPPQAPQPPAPPQAPQAAAPPAGAPAGGKVNLDKGRVNLRKNETVSLVKNGRPMLSLVRMGLGWSPSTHGRNIDLDASVIAYDAQRKKVDNAWFMKLKIFGGAIQHSGDNLTGQGSGGDNEVISVDLGRVPDKVTGLVFVVNSFSGQKFTEVANAYCRLLDGNGSDELVRFDLTNSEPRTGVIMCKLIRQYSGEWEMTGIGEFVDSKTVRGMIKPSAATL